MANTGELFARVKGFHTAISGGQNNAPGLGGYQGRLDSVRNAYYDRLQKEREKNAAAWFGAAGGGRIPFDQLPHREMGGGGRYRYSWGDSPVPPAGYVPAGTGADRWKEVAIAALRYEGMPEAWIGSLIRRLGQESSGDNRAVNDWDINAQRGDPTQGLMQHIPSAWNERARELAARSIWDGFANIVASIRYANQRYGQAPRGWDRQGGY